MPLQQQCPHQKAMSDHLWATGSCTSNKITDIMAFYQTTYVPHRTSIWRRNIFFFSPQKHFGITALRVWKPSVFSCHREALRPVNRVGHYWFGGRKMDSECDTDGSWEKKMLQYYRHLATISHEVELWGRACFIYVDCCNWFRGDFRPTHNSDSQFHQSEKSRVWQTNQSFRLPQINESWTAHHCTLILISSVFWSLLGCTAAS